MKKKVSLILIINIVVAVVAFGFNLGVVNAQNPDPVRQAYIDYYRSTLHVSTTRSGAVNADEQTALYNKFIETARQNPENDFSKDWFSSPSVALAAAKKVIAKAELDPAVDINGLTTTPKPADLIEPVGDGSPSAAPNPATTASIYETIKANEEYVRYGVVETESKKPCVEKGNAFSNIFGIGGCREGLKERGETPDDEKSLTAGQGSFFDIIISAASWGGLVYAGTKIIGGFLFDDQEKVNAAALALGIGVGVGRYTYGALAENGFGSGFLGGIKSSVEAIPGVPELTVGQFSTLLGAGVAIGVFLLTYKSEDTKTIKYECLPWEAPIGGSKCEECNKDPNKPCSEYRCKSLGQACGIVNPGTSEEKCVWINPKDVNAPQIRPWIAPLLQGHKYENDNTIQPPDAGVKIINSVSTTGCVKAFTPLRFGILTNEPAQCKIDYNRPGAGQEGYDAMQFFIGGSNLLRQNHTEILSLPGPNASSSGSPTIANNGEFSLFVRCTDANGNSNDQSFVFNFCVEKGPDTTQPVIVTTSLLNKMPVAFDTKEIPLDVFTNEPAECRWSRSDLDYDSMENSMQCSNSIFDFNAQMLYKCATTLTGLKNQQDNNYFFRCKDQPSAPENERNKNTESLAFTIKGTQTLNILNFKPNGTIKDSTNIVSLNIEVETANGFKEGESICYYSSTGNDEDYIQFFESNSHLHKQNLNLPEGDYTYYVKCIDLGGNTDTKITAFTIDSDNSAPLVVRAFHEETKLKLITNEKATCSFSTTSCNFNIEEGISFRNINDVEQIADWTPGQSYYVRCLDQYNNVPVSNQCSIIVRPVEVISRED